MKKKRLSRKLSCSIVLIVMLLLILTEVPCLNFSTIKTVNADKLKSKIIVSLGDSYSAGEGVEEFYGQDKKISKKIKDADWLAHRSKKSWPGQLYLKDVGIMSEHRGKNWFFAASSGAKAVDIAGYKIGKNDNSSYKMYDGKVVTKNSKKPIVGQEKYYFKHRKDRLSSLATIGAQETMAYKGLVYLPPQLDVFDQLGNKKADYVTLTLGGNDARFGDIVSEVVTGGTTVVDYSKLPKLLKDVWTEFYKKGGTRDSLKRAYKQIETKAGKQATIIVAGYPRLFEKNGMGPFPSKKEAQLVNNNITAFNCEIEELVRECAREGMNICFVDVAEEFNNSEAYTDEPFINSVMTKQNEDINESLVRRHYNKKEAKYINKPDPASAYSMHPNTDGLSAYAYCVQKKINELELKKEIGIEATDDLSGKTSERDVVLVLDNSNSMEGNPLEETKSAANKFVNNVLKKKARVGAVEYSEEGKVICPFTKNMTTVNKTIKQIKVDGGTNISEGLATADSMLSNSSAKKKIIVLMSDGEPTHGYLDQDLLDYAKRLKKKGYYIYTLGFFESADDVLKAQYLMEHIASEGCHYEVSNSDSLVFFFGDIADQINGQKYIYVRIACPVEVSVMSNGEKLNSSKDDSIERASFGSITYEDNDTQNMKGYNFETYNKNSDTVKILRLKEGEDYNVHIKGTGKGKMNYSIGFVDDNGEYSDFRKFKNIRIGKKTKIDTVAQVSRDTTLNVDENGDGKYEKKYKAGSNQVGTLVKEPNYTSGIVILVGFIFSILLLIVMIILLKKTNKKSS